MADIDYFDSRVLTGVINRRPVKYDIFGNMFRRQAPKATELFELHVVSRGVSMLPSITNAAGGTMRSGREGAVLSEMTAAISCIPISFVGFFRNSRSPLNSRSK